MGSEVCGQSTFEVLDCEVEGILGMPFLKQFNPVIDWTTGATTIDEHSIPLVEHETHTNDSRLEEVSAKAFLKGNKQGKYTWCGHVDPL